MAKLDKSALKSAMNSVATTLGLIHSATTPNTAEATERRAARIAAYQQALRDGGYKREVGTRIGQFRKLSAMKQLEYAVKLVRIGGELPAEYVAKTSWANAAGALEALADAANIERSKMLAAFGVKSATDTAPPAQVVATVEGMQVIARTEAPAPAEAANVVPMTLKGGKKGKKTA